MAQNITAIAYNARCIIPEVIIFSGSRDHVFDGGQGLNMRFLHSLNFLSMPLSKFAKTFELREMKKGFFLHCYHTPDHENSKLPFYLTCITIILTAWQSIGDINFYICMSIIKTNHLTSRKR